MQSTTRAHWSSHFAFILATVGSAVGLGNIWRFPYIVGENGGAAFLLVYIALIVSFCLIPIVCELFLGKTYQKNILGVYGSVNKKLKNLGWFCIITCFMVCGFYFVIGGWILQYVWMYMTDIEPANYKQYFNDFTARPILPISLAFIFLAVTAIFPYLGVNKGIEKANNIMMPLFIIMLIGLAAFSLTLPNSMEGVKFLFYPNFAKIDMNMVLTALGQALFTLSIGFGALITYGSYLKKDTNIVKSSYTLIAIDTLIAIIAGIMIFPAVFSTGLAPESGPTLIFITLPEVFSRIPMGDFVAIVFFGSLVFAAVTSGISMLENIILAFVEEFKMSRGMASFVVSTIVAVLIIPSALSFGELSDYKIFGRTFFDLFDYITANLLLPFNTLLAIVLVGWFIKPKTGVLFSNNKANVMFNILTKYFAPLIIISLIILGL